MMTHTLLFGATLGCVSLHPNRRAEHFMGMPAERTRRWTAREVRQLIAESPTFAPRYELVDGELLVTPAPSPAHQEAVSSLLFALRMYCEQHHVGRALTSPSDIELEAEDIRQPDVFILPDSEWRRTASEGWPARVLLLAVEVLSPSSARVDRLVKRPKYQRLAQEYWIFDLDARVVERWRPDDDRPEVVTDTLTWSPVAHATPLELDLEPFFKRVHAED